MNLLDKIRTWWIAPGRAVELKAERVRSQINQLASRIRFLPYIDSETESPARRRAYRLMLREPAIKAALLDKTLSVSALDMAVNIEQDDTSGQQVGAFCLYALAHVSGGDFGLQGLPAIVEAVILPGLIDGLSIAEKVWCVEERGRWKGKVKPRWLKSRDLSTLDLTYDEHGNLTGITDVLYRGTEFPVNDFVIWKHLSVFDVEHSDLQAAYRAYWLSDTAWKLRAIHLEKYSAGPMMLGTYVTSDQKPSLEEALEFAKASTWISIPEGAKVEAIQLSQLGTSDFKAAIDDLKHEMFLGISGSILQSLEGSTTEGRGSSAIHKSTADIRKWHIRSCVESVVNAQLIPDIVDLNFSGAELPTVGLGGIDDHDMTASLAVDAGLGQMGLALSRKDIYKRYGRPTPVNKEDELLPPVSPTPGPAPFSENGNGGPANAVPFAEARAEIQVHVQKVATRPLVPRR